MLVTLPTTAQTPSPVNIPATLKAGATAFEQNYEAESVPATTSGPKIQIVDDNDASGGKCIEFVDAHAGEYMQYTLADVPAGYYTLHLNYKQDKNRGAAVVSVNGRSIGSFIDQRDVHETRFVRHDVSTFFQPAAGPVVVRLTHIGSLGGTNPKLSVDALVIKTDPVKNDLEKGENEGDSACENMRVDAVALARQLQVKPLVAGAGHAPFYALPVYSPDGSDIPAGALDRKDYSSTAAWLDTMEAQHKPGKIGSGTYDLKSDDFQSRALTQSIYGYDTGRGRPVLEGHGRSSLFYLRASGIRIQYLTLRNMGIPIISIDHWKSYNFGGKKGLLHWPTYQPDTHAQMVHDADIDDIAVMDCRFENIGIAVLFIKEFHGIHDIHIGRNQAIGGSGFTAFQTYDFDDIYFYQNRLTDFDQGTHAANWAQTLLWVGTNDITHKQTNRNVFAEFNEARNIRSAHSYNKVNAAVFCDIRDCSNVSIAYNVFKDMVNTKAHSDCNVVYSKTDDLMIDHCVFENCGANDSPDDGDIGSEGGCITLKDHTSDAARFGTIIQNCTFIAGSITEVPMILFNHDGVLRNCTFKGWQWTGTNNHRRYMIQKYSGKSLLLENLKLIDCGGKGACAVREDNAVTAIVNWPTTNFDDDRTAIFTGVNFTANANNDQGVPLCNK
ncbi:hypothetical protein HED60_12770 [Planctomycetales bacterium ZRK34]|nr:hypothetical protein HED60_12770 [Planctomycetales bacterium ZRK34]